MKWKDVEPEPGSVHERISAVVAAATKLAHESALTEFGQAKKAPRSSFDRLLMREIEKRLNPILDKFFASEITDVELRYRAHLAGSEAAKAWLKMGWFRRWCELRK